jgi:putative ABC transport system permease protein
MWLITVRDLQWRRKRFGFGVIGTALVFAVTLLLAGLSSSLREEARHTVAGAGADAWIVAGGVTGPFSGLSGLPPDAVPAVAAAPGVTQADPLVVAFAAVEGRQSVDVTVFGVRPGGLGTPAVKAGRTLRANGEAVVDRALGVKVGQRFVLSGRTFTAVGEVDGYTLRAGLPNVYLPVEDAQAVFFKGAPLITTILAKGSPQGLENLTILTSAQAETDMLRNFRSALQAIDLLRMLLWLVAAAIVGTVIYLSVLERIGDFAVLRATGTAGGALLGSLIIQAVIVSVVSAAVANLLARFIEPTFPMPIDLRGSAGLVLLALSVGIGVLASAGALRRAVKVDPAIAFGAA